MSPRIVFNFMLFAVLLVGIGVFVQQTHGEGRQPTSTHIAVVTVLGAAWAALLVAFAEHRVYPLADKGKRALLAAGLGALAYLGLFVAVAALSWAGPPSAVFLGLGLLLGAGSHAIRAALYGGPPTGTDVQTQGAHDQP
jgi:predicted transporter